MAVKQAGTRRKAVALPRVPGHSQSSSGLKWVQFTLGGSGKWISKVSLIWVLTRGWDPRAEGVWFKIKNRLD